MDGRRRGIGGGRSLGLSGLIGLGSIGSLALGLPGPLAYAGPRGGVVTHGQAAIARSGASTVIDQTSNRAALSWESFDIRAGERVQFRQPSTSAIALNTIRNNRPTEIQGSLTANGQVWLQNPAGVLFGRGAEVDVGGILATTGRIDAADFAEGRDRFEGGTGAVVNEGRIRAGEGGVAFVAPVVENRGLIETRGGDVSLAAADGFAVDMDGDGLLGIVVEAAEAEALSLVNEGTIRAEGGAVHLTAAQAAGVRQSVVSVGGIVEATGIAEMDGEIVILGGETARLSGSLTATRGEAGGHISVNAGRIALEQGARVDVSAPEGGGRIEIGPRSAPMPPKRIVAAAGSRVAADATGAGDAGRIDFWSEEVTLVRGEVSAAARGTGDAGFIDISSAGSIGFTGAADLSAAEGRPGTLLFDPTFIYIAAGSGFDDPQLDDDQILLGDEPSFMAISPDALAATSPGATIYLEATDGIGFYSPVTLPTQSLSLYAGNTIGFYAPLTLTTGSLDATGGFAVRVGSSGSLSVGGTLRLFGLGEGEGAGVRLLGPVRATGSALLSGNVLLTDLLDVGGNLTITTEFLYTGCCDAELDVTGDTTLNLFSDSGVYFGNTSISTRDLIISSGDLVEFDYSTILARNIRAEDTRALKFYGSGVTASGGFQARVSYLSSYGDGTPPPLSFGGPVRVTADNISLYTEELSAPSVDMRANVEAVVAPDILDVSGNVRIEGGEGVFFGAYYGAAIGGDLTLVGSDAPIVMRGTGEGTLDLTVDGQTALLAGNSTVTLEVDATAGDLRIVAGGTPLVIGSDASPNILTEPALEGFTGEIDLTGNAGLSVQVPVTLPSGELVLAGPTVAVNAPLALPNGGLTVEGGAVTLDADPIDIAGDVTISGSTVDIGGQLNIAAGDLDLSGTSSVNVGTLAQSGNTVFGIFGGIAVGTGTIDIEAPLVTLFGDVVNAGGDVTVASSGDILLDSSATIFGDSVTLSSGGTITQATVLSPLQPTFTIIGSGTDPNDGITVIGQDVAIYGTLESAGFLDVTATGPASANDGSIFIGDQPPGPVPNTTVVLGSGVPGGIVDVGADATFRGGTIEIESPVFAGGTVRATATSSIAVANAADVSGNRVRFDAGSGSISLGSEVLIEGLAATSPGVQLRAGSFAINPAADVEADFARVIFTGNGTLGGTTGNLSEAEFAAFADSDDVTILALGNLSVFDLEPPAGFSTSRLTLSSAGGTVNVTGALAGGDGEGQYRIDFGEESGATRPSAVTIPGRVGLLALGGGSFQLQPPEGLYFYVNGDVITATGVTNGSTIIAADGLTVIDITGSFLQENTTGNPSPLLRGQGAAGAVLEALRIDSAAAVEIYGTIGGETADAAAREVTFGPGFSPFNVHQVNDCALNNPNCNLPPSLSGAIIDTDEDMASAPLDISALATDPEGDAVTLNQIAGVAVAPGVTIPGPEGGVFVVLPNGTVLFDPLDDFQDLPEGDSTSFAVPVRLIDALGDATNGTLTVTVLGLNDAPTAMDGALAADADMPSDPLAPDAIGMDIDMDVLRFVRILGQDVTPGTRIALPGGGVLVVLPNGSVVFDPNGAFGDLGEGETVQVAVPVVLSDPFGAQVSALIRITVNGLEQLFALLPGSIETDEDMAAPPLAPGALAGDPATGPLTFVEIDGMPVGGGAAMPVEGGSLSVDAAGNLVFTPGPDFQPLMEGASTSFSVTVTLENAQGQRQSTPVTITVAGRNDVPGPLMGMIETDEDMASGPLPPGALATDIDMDMLFVTEIAGQPVVPGAEIALPDGGVLRVDASGALVFDPGDAFRGLAAGESQSFTVQVTVADPFSGTATGPLQITVRGLQTPPQGLDPLIATPEDMVSDPLPPTEIALDPDMAGLTIVEVEGMPVSAGDAMPMEGGTLFVDANGNLFFDPGPDFLALTDGQTREFSVDVTLADGTGTRVTVPVVVRVLGLNSAPVPIPPDGGPGTGPGIVTNEREPGSIGPGGIAFDPEMEGLVIVAVDGMPVGPGSALPLEGGGVLLIGPDGSLIFDPGTDFEFLRDNEMVDFAVLVTLADPFGLRTDAEVTITVLGINDAPRISPIAITTDQDTPAPGVEPGEIAFDPEMDPITLLTANGQPLQPGAVIPLASGGVLIVAADGSLIFDPLGDFVGLGAMDEQEILIPITLSDAAGAEGEGSLLVRVRGLNDAPVPQMPDLATDQNSLSPGLSPGDAARDPDLSDTLRVISVNGTPIAPGGSVALEQGGVLRMLADGTLVFDPGADFRPLPVGGDQMLEVVLGLADGSGVTVPVRLGIDVAGLNDDPVARDDPAGTTRALSPVRIPVLANDTDIDADALSVVRVNGLSLASGSVPGPEGGRFFVDARGNLVFDPGTDFLGLSLGSVVAFPVEYGIADGFGGFASAFTEVRVEGDAGSTSVFTFTTTLATPSVLSDAVLTPDQEVLSGFFNDLGFIEPTLVEEEPITNRGDDENWPR